MSARGYEPRWDIDEADGYQGELFTQWAMKAIVTGASVEVKTDRESWRTGNLYIEQECWVSSQWVASGINTTQAGIWAHIVVGPLVLFAPTAYVRYAAEKYGKHRECRTGSHPTRGKVLPIGQFVALLGRLNKRWLAGDSSLAIAPGEPAAPFGRWPDGRPLTPYGLNKDGGIRLQPGGRRADHAAPDGLWPETGGAA